VVPAEVAGGHLATETLIEAGHRRIAFINGEPWMDAAQDRLSGYRRALASHDIAYDPALVREGDWQLASGYEHTLSLMRLKPRPSAIFCANDLMALGCLEALRKLDLAVPDAVSVIGYDDQEVSRHTHPPLTTLVLPSYEMGRLAVETLLAEADNPASRRRRLKVECRIVERSSVGPPPREGKRR
jgi:LacI family transcriptional regulator